MKKNAQITVTIHWTHVLCLVAGIGAGYYIAKKRYERWEGE